MIATCFVLNQCKSVLLFDTDSSVFRKSEAVALQGSRAVVEQYLRIVVMAVDTHLEMQVLGGSPPCAARECYYLACLDVVAHLDQVFRVVAVQCLQSVGMPEYDAVAIAGERLRHGDDAVEDCQNVVVGLRLDVHPGVAVRASRAVGTDDLGTRQRIVPLSSLDGRQV